ncbi:hypothetical protein RB195_002719 [Necator americanus]|uniref:Uncharacterized protein n=1 Tax=Necator americanus TaxID=51031 RepID=A0ABR1DKD1_NECAM
MLVLVAVAVITPAVMTLQCWTSDIVLAPSRLSLTELEYDSDVVIFDPTNTKIQHRVNLVSKVAVTYDYV